MPSQRRHRDGASLPSVPGRTLCGSEATDLLRNYIFMLLRAGCGVKRQSPGNCANVVAFALATHIRRGGHRKRSTLERTATLAGGALQHFADVDFLLPLSVVAAVLNEIFDFLLTDDVF